jgi:diguanylate cyclase (GGDEF)-like protein/PAS domain S-box-containing protein
MQSSYDHLLVALSTVIAILASYTALALAGRIALTQGGARTAWLLGGSVALGSGIWSMHFVGMLAFHLPVPIAYDAQMVGLSLVAAVAASTLTLIVASRLSVGPSQLVTAGFIMGAGIAAMHYSGMAALRMAARLEYDVRPVLLSAVVAVSASTAALWIFRRLRDDTSDRGRSLRAGAAVLLGLAIAGSHYTAIAGVRFEPTLVTDSSPGIMLATGAGLGYAVASATFLVLVLTLTGAIMDHWVRMKLAAADALRESEERYRSVVGEIQEVIFRTDAAGRWIFLNPAWTEITGFNCDESLGTALADYVHAEDRSEELAAFQALAEGNEISARREVRYRTKSGGVRWLEVHARVSRGVDGVLVGLAGTLRDVTERHEAEEALRDAEAQLAHQALHDPLTGLANRVLFRDRVEHALGRAVRGERVAVLFLDLDNFKAVNDSLGHAEGDRLLETVATRLLRATRGLDTVARLGGDEFAILLEGMGQESDVPVVVDRIASAMRRPIPLQGREVTITASIGVAHMDAGQGVEEVLRNADLAMYRAKAAGKGGHEVFEPGMHAAVLERLDLETDLRKAVDRAEFRLVYQPIVECETGRPLGAEALLRWHHPTRGVVPPTAFIPMAEETGLILPIGRWVLIEACREAQRWQSDAAGAPTPSLSVNLSGRQLMDPALVEIVAGALSESGLQPSLLTLEITESVLMQDTESTLRALHELKALGVRLAIDDFGTGYSSLSYLKRFPIDALKIDKAFIDGVARGGSDAALARAIVTLAGMLGLSTVAEGVEYPKQRDQLVTLGCSHGQGYLFARPLVAGEIRELLGASKTNERDECSVTSHGR